MRRNCLLLSSLLITNLHGGREFRKKSTTSVERVKKFAQLSNNSKTLSLSNLHISDLSGLKDLIPDECTYLNLSKNHLKNWELKSFKEIFSTKVETINLEENDFTNITEDQLKQLKESFPQLNTLLLSKKQMAHWDAIHQKAKQLNIWIKTSGNERHQLPIIPYIYSSSYYGEEEPFSSDGQQSPESITLSDEEETVPLLTNSTSSESSDTDDE
ncbi:MAG TPA: hypothetical protein VHO47_02205 [Candidatus Babeliales bacterium]|nr:hypothetical protein [Candidatus Babeliales bacterium]